MFLAVRGFFRMICLIHNLPNTCLVGFKSLFHGSTFPVEEQVWKWGGASWHASIVTNHLSPPLSFYPTKRTCLCSDLWLHWHAEHVNSRTRVYVGSTRKQNSKKTLTLTVWTCLNRILTPTYHGDAMAKYGNGFNPLTLLIYSAVAIWCRWDSFNLCWSLAAAGWTFNHPRIHNRPSLPIRKHSGLWNTSILSRGTQLKISCWRTSTWQDVLALSQGLQKSYINSASGPGTQKSLTQSCCSWSIMHKRQAIYSTNLC